MENFTDLYCFRLGALTRRIARYYNHRFDELGITLGQSFVLFSLYERDGSSVKELATVLQLDSPAVTGLVDRLVKQDLVLRQENPHDRRSTLVFLTPTGQSIAERAAAITLEFNPYLQRHLAEGSLLGLEQTLTQLETELELAGSKL